MNDKHKFSPPMVGGSSLLVIFAVLCLTIFALLSLSTVQAGGRLGDASARATETYYAADCAAEEVLAQLRGGTVPAGVTETDGVYAYSCPISDTQMLEVEVRLAGAAYEILRWQAVAVGQRQPNDDLTVWEGEEVPSVTERTVG